MFQSVLRIRIGFNADPELAFYFSKDADADPDPGAKPMRIHADPDPGQTLRSQKLDFDM